jgi:hypothetical protein
MTAVSYSDALGFTTINGLPAHVLLVHAVVVFVPLAAFSLVAALKPSVARRFGRWLPGLAAVAFASVLAAMNAGGWLQHHVQDTKLVRAHTAIAGQLWPFSLLVVVLSIAVWWVNGRTVTGDEVASPAEPEHSSMRAVAGGTVTTVVVAVLAVAVAVGSIVQVVRIGDSGSKASWHDHFSQSAVHGGGSG